MNNSELIQDFMDGALSVEEENNLLFMLAHDEDVRAEFKRSLAIENSLRKDADSLSPSAMTTVSLYGALGFAAPAGALDAISSRPSPLRRLYNKYYQAFYASIVSIAVTASLLLFFDLQKFFELNHSDRNISTTNKTKANTIIPAVSGMENYESAHVNTSVKNLNSTVKRNSINSKYQNRDYAGLQQYFNGYAGEEAQHSIDSPGLSDDHTSPAKLDLSLPVRLIGTEHKPISVYLSKIEKEIPLSEKMGVSLQVSGNYDWAVPSASLQRSDSKPYNNSSIALYYNIGNNLEIGAEVRREFFFQRYTGLSANGRMTEYEQYPNFLSYGITGKYKFTDFLGLDAFVQPAFAFNSAGIIFRTMAGVELFPSIDYRIYLAPELCLFAYQHLGNPFAAYKFSINYGVAFNF
ncbi:MAG: hypothetical protein QG635_79 [Bacteroidota bacterium]|nr:hypothetical protein [Bacteroidota bacterium]